MSDELMMLNIELIFDQMIKKEKSHINMSFTKLAVGRVMTCMCILKSIPEWSEGNIQQKSRNQSLVEPRSFLM